MIFNPGPEACALHDALAALLMSSDWLLRELIEAKKLLDDGDEPNASDWPGRVPGDRRWLSAEQIRRSSYLSLPAYQARQTGWPHLLDEINERLTDWWAGWQRAVTALQALPRTAVDDLGRDFETGKPWPVSVLRSLIDLADPISATGPKLAGGEPMSVDVRAMVECLKRSGVPDWSEASERLRQFDADVRSLDGRQAETTPTWQDLAARFEAIQSKARREKVPDSLFWTERSKGVPVVESPDGLQVGPEIWELEGEPSILDGCSTPAASFETVGTLAGAKLLQSADLPQELRDTPSHFQRWLRLLTRRPHITKPAVREVKSGADGYDRRHWTMYGIVEASRFCCEQIAAAGELSAILAAATAATVPEHVSGAAGAAAKPAAPITLPVAVIAEKSPTDIERSQSSLANAAEISPQYVTLGQMAAMVQRSPRTLEKWKSRKANPIPSPDIEGGGGKPAEWDWLKVRHWLEQETGRLLPERFPSLQPPLTETNRS